MRLRPLQQAFAGYVLTGAQAIHAGSPRKINEQSVHGWRVRRNAEKVT